MVGQLGNLTYGSEFIVIYIWSSELLTLYFVSGRYVFRLVGGDRTGCLLILQNDVWGCWEMPTCS
ncbi:uncharacterized protein Smp_200010 [Schistosoma mansoni]|uniref:uncharacterized protein n=1 Tax=Schistosoma mansoni TaxID=6183 RepID=UPI00022DC3D2|nr:uncharacterized protein Smp_200010 [Schistosoma mansoni]|eukprot:XP_018649037.1 uncharacterized protein Smp_200010 [Schistosoma mansoni]